MHILFTYVFVFSSSAVSCISYSLMSLSFLLQQCLAYLVHLCFCLFFFSSVLHILFTYEFVFSSPAVSCISCSLMRLSFLLQQCLAYLVHLGWFLRWEVSGHTAAVIWHVSFRICSKQYVSILV